MCIRDRLKRYAGLTVGACGSGVEVSKSDIEFRIPDTDNPEEFNEKVFWEKAMNTKLISIAHVHHQHGELFIAENGFCFGRSYIHDAMWLEGETFSITMKTLLAGYRVKPMLRPDQAVVSVYGVEYNNESAGVFEWKEL